MYLWKVDSLVEDFKSGSVTQKEEFKYMLLSTIIMAFLSDPAWYIGAPYNYYDTITTIAMLCISSFGIYYCFKINSHGDNKDFIVRVICISFPVLIRVSAVISPVVIVGIILEDVFLPTESPEKKTIENTPTQVVITSTFVAAYYWYLSTKIKAVSSKNN